LIRYLLDTDAFSLWRAGNEGIAVRLRPALVDGTVAVSVIAVEEQLGGWLSLLRRANSTEREARVYAEISRSMALFALVPVLPMTESALLRFEELRRGRLNVGAMDLRVAALALDRNLTVVTRNRRDYERVPGVSLEDWTTET
jgi:tRNA(fMet)-specific endonuclease VapC